LPGTSSGTGPPVPAMTGLKSNEVIDTNEIAAGAPSTTHGASSCANAGEPIEQIAPMDANNAAFCHCMKKPRHNGCADEPSVSSFGKPST
jgi:hypothetical protein